MLNPSNNLLIQYDSMYMAVISPENIELRNHCVLVLSNENGKGIGKGKGNVLTINK